MNLKSILFAASVIPCLSFTEIIDLTPELCPKPDFANTPWCQCVFYHHEDACDDIETPELGALALMPSRLSFATFASQNGYLASAQVVTDHLHQKRLVSRKPKNREVAAIHLSTENLLADAKDCPPTLCKNEGYFTGWLGPFGEYAHEKPQLGVAAFSFNVGGAVVGMDYNCINDDVIGLGAAYVYTHVDEDADAGHANVNQGFLGIYSTLHATKWGFDLALWGGYYHTNNVRNNPFIVPTTLTTKSDTHGWQLAPHIEVSYDGYLPNICGAGWFGLSPFVLADWVATWEHGFSEHGAPGYNMRQQGKFCSLFRGETGLRFHEIVRYGWGALMFEEKGSYAYQKMFNTGTVTSSIIGLPGTFTFTTLTGAQNLGVVEFCVSLKPSNVNMPYADFRYQGEFGSQYQSHQGIVELGKDF